MDDYLTSIYYDPKNPGSFSGPRALYKAVRADGKRIISTNKIKKWLKSQEVYTMHRKVVHKFKRNRVYVEHIDDQWDVDLMDMAVYAKENGGVRFVLLAIDIFSRFAWAVPLMSKQAKDVVKGFDELLKKANQRKPVKIRSDHGGEFVNKQMKKWFKDHNILHSVTTNEVKANYVERLVKTIKGRIVKMFHHENNFQYADHLDDVMDSYNHTYHSTLKRRPAQVTKKNEDIVYAEQYIEPLLKKNLMEKSTTSVKVDKKKKKKHKKRQPFRFNIGQEVRISYLRKLFDREYDQKWTGEVFTVKNRWVRDGIPVYELLDYGKEPVKGTFYEQELQAVTLDPDQSFKIEKVIRSRGRGKKKEHFVKWLNWPQKYNQWIPDDELLSLQS